MDKAKPDDTQIQFTRPIARPKNSDEPERKAGASVAPDQKRFSRTGFLTEGISVPEDFDVMGARDIEQMFGARLRAL